jgi:para-nitrobenzyl esterase
MYLMAAPQARGLFAKAIAESAYMVSAPGLAEPLNGMVPAEQQGVALAEKLGAADLAALRALPAEAIADKPPAAGYFPFPAVDGKIVPRQLVETFDRGEQAPVPILAGFNSGEIRSLRFLLPKPPADAAAYEAAIRANYGEFADAFLARYPAMEQWKLHAFHASELPYVFGTAGKTPALWPKIPDTLAERKLAQAMGDYWASFAKDAKPKATGAPDWPDYADDHGFVHFAGEPRAAHNLFPGTAALHEAVVCRRRVAGDIPWNWNIGLASPPLPPKAEGCQ